MKKMMIALVIIGLVLTSAANGQITNTPVSADSSLMINNIYAGMLSNVNFFEDFQHENHVSLRLGAQASWQIMPWLQLKTYGTYDRTGGKDEFSNSFSFKGTYQKIFIEAGRTATPVTEMRPLPPTADGHFETWTEAQMPGGSVGVKAGYSFKPSYSITLGVHERNGQAEFGSRLELKKINLGGSYQLAGKKVSVAASYKTERLFHFSSLVNSEETGLIVGHFTNVQVIPQLNFYVDAGYSFKEKDSPRMETGFIKNFAGEWIKGLIAIGYAYEIKAIKGYLFVHLWRMDKRV